MLSSWVAVVGAFLSPATPNTAVRTKLGEVRVVGDRGPPVLFQSGLFNAIPRFMYREFLGELEKSLTLVYTQRAPLDGDGVEHIADAIGAQTIGLLAHSSVTPSLVTSPRLERSVLLDPVMLPAGFTPFDGLVSRRLRASAPTRILRAGRSTERFIPRTFELDLPEAEVVVFDSAGHSDILDDLYATAGSKLGIVGLDKGLARNNASAYDEWTSRQRSTTSASRREYRLALAREAVSFFSGRGGDGAE